MNKNFPYYILLAVLISGCGKDEVIPEDEFVKVYVDILVAKDTLQDKSISPDSIKSLVLIQHDIPASVYANAIDYYNSSEEKWEKFFDKAIKYAEELKAANEK